MAGKKSDKNTQQTRLDTIIELKTQGYTRADIMQYVASLKGKQAWNISTRQIDQYIKKANDYFEAEGKINRAVQIGKATRRYELAIKTAFTLFNVDAAIRGQKALDELHGLQAPKKIDVGKTKIIVGLKKS